MKKKLIFNLRLRMALYLRKHGWIAFYPNSHLEAARIVLK